MISTIYSGLTKSRGFAWPQVLCTGPVGIFSVVSRFDALERKCEKSLGVEVQIVRQPARRSDGFAIPRPDGLRFADRRNRLSPCPHEPRQTDASLQGRLRPGTWHLHGCRVLGP